MSQLMLLAIVISAVALLLLLVLRFKINAFIALIVTSMYVGLATGMKPDKVLESIQNGMGGTLGFVATVVGLGAIFGALLEHSGGARSLAHYLVGKFGYERASWAMVLTGFIVAIPVFFDVGFIILVPIVYALSRDTGRPVLYYGIPLLAGLAVTHSFIPPTPGPVAVAEIVGANLGWVILLGFIVGLPTAIIAGPVFGKYISKRITASPPAFLQEDEKHTDTSQLPNFSIIAALIGVPLLLILVNTISGVLVSKKIIAASTTTDIISFLGHPFTALTLATLLSLYFLGTKRGVSGKELLDISTKALGPAGIIILITGAGGVFKQVLIDSGIGKMLAHSIANSALPPLLLAWLLAAVVRVTQGSSTVAMITAAGIMAPVLEVFDLSAPHRALIVLSIAAGATILSHVNDSGFWLVGKYFGISEKQTLQSWTVMETIISVSGLILSLGLSFFV
ncbi:gluconate:H+ symporter [Prolixibacter sp. NT017]|uniref:GntT/GntP/DsdX family permease n=1 Tax=Prolixibacter sp. NT017 TaxID=2652390 RepID=UPI00128678D1|nr:gluconate:H+ symporter [Prolixibacter sp. NT017]GET23768.1 gluconate transporter [Prolixibacter sp. NT017]